MPVFRSAPPAKVVDGTGHAGCRSSAFGGGAHIIDLGARKSIGWTSTQEWLAAALNGEDVDA